MVRIAERQKAEEARLQEQLEQERIAAEEAEKIRQAEIAKQAGKYHNNHWKWRNQMPKLGLIYLFFFIYI